MEDWTKEGKYSSGTNLEDVVEDLRLGQQGGGPESGCMTR
jgi:hypothetical protein